MLRGPGIPNVAGANRFSAAEHGKILTRHFALGRQWKAPSSLGPSCITVSRASARTNRSAITRVRTLYETARLAERLGGGQHPPSCCDYAATGSRVWGVGLTLEVPSVKENSISGRRPLTISARARPEPQECVHPSVPCPVFK
jgi:hypothetical protein